MAKLTRILRQVLVKGIIYSKSGKVLRRWYGRNRYGTQDRHYRTITDPSQGLS